MRHILFEIPTPWWNIPVMGYGAMIVAGFLLATFWACRRAKRCGENPENIVNISLLALIGGIGGARLLFVLENLDGFAAYPFPRNVLEMFNIRAGGLVYFGGLILASLLAVGYMLRKKMSVRRTLDIIAPSLMLGLAFGRAGCTLNGCCYGGHGDLHCPAAQHALSITFPYGSPPYQDQSALPWRIVDERTGEAVGYMVPSRLGSRYHVPADGPPAGPMLDVPRRFLVPLGASGAATQGDEAAVFSLRDRESIASPEDKAVAERFRSLPVYPAQPLGVVNALLLAATLAMFFRRRKREGQVFALMLVLKAVTRFALEAVRKDTDPNLFGLTTSQNISIVLFVAGVLMFWAISRMPAVAPVPLSGKAVAGNRP